MKNALLTVLQFILFLFAFAAGSFIAPMKMRQVLSITPEGTRVFLWDGVVWAALLLLAILLIQAGSKRLRNGAPWTLLALVLALTVGLALRLGFMTI